MITTLYSNGCGNSFMMQPEIFSDPPKNSEGTFPGLIAKKMHIDKFISGAEEYSSNDRIYRTTIDWIAKNYLTPNKPTDNLFVLINWTDYLRREYFWEKTTETKRITWPDLTTLFVKYWPEGIDKIAGGCKLYWKLHKENGINEEFEQTRWLNQIIMLQGFLKVNNIKYIFTNTEKELYRDSVVELAAIDNLLYFEWPMKHAATNMGYKIGPTTYFYEDFHQKWSETLYDYMVKNAVV